MFDHILIAVGEERMDVATIAEYAVAVAEKFDADVTLFRAYPKGEFDRRLAEFEYDAADPTDMAKRNSVVREAAHIVRAAGLDLSIVGAVGDPATTVVEYVDSHSVDHVFIGGRKRSPTGKAIMGSTSQDIILRLSVPCTVMQLG
ncbi:universal stress protein [Halobium salinum]|uniref:Universal stress protein n=1 Tax=Halobium salinum TaxID=1364940 RepID=A0ABD5PJE2_9EURY|nr:universal stress protein [Halobium salinum]